MGIESKSGGSIWEGFEEWKLQREEEKRQTRRKAFRRPRTSGGKSFNQKAGDLIARVNASQRQQINELPPSLRL